MEEPTVNEAKTLSAREALEILVANGQKWIEVVDCLMGGKDNFLASMGLYISDPVKDEETAIALGAFLVAAAGKSKSIIISVDDYNVFSNFAIEIYPLVKNGNANTKKR